MDTAILVSSSKIPSFSTGTVGADDSSTLSVTAILNSVTVKLSVC